MYRRYSGKEHGNEVSGLLVSFVCVPNCADLAGGLWLSEWSSFSWESWARVGGGRGEMVALLIFMSPLLIFPNLPGASDSAKFSLALESSYLHFLWPVTGSSSFFIFKFLLIL